MPPRWVLGCLLAVGGCAHASATPVTGPDGATWYAIDCTRGRTNCEREAGEACPGGYDLAAVEGHVRWRPDAASNAGEEVVSGFQGRAPVLVSEQVYEGHMLIKCRGDVTRARRECLDDNSCEAGQRCIFASGAKMGRCGL